MGQIKSPLPSHEVSSVKLKVKVAFSEYIVLFGKLIYFNYDIFDIDLRHFLNNLSILELKLEFNRV